MMINCEMLVQAEGQNQVINMQNSGGGLQHSDGHRTGEGGRVTDSFKISDVIFEQPHIQPNNTQRFLHMVCAFVRHVIKLPVATFGVSNSFIIFWLAFTFEILTYYVFCIRTQFEIFSFLLHSVNFTPENKSKQSE